MFNLKCVSYERSKKMNFHQLLRHFESTPMVFGWISSPCHPLMGSPSWSAQCWKIPNITSGSQHFRCLNHLKPIEIELKPHWKYLEIPMESQHFCEAAALWRLPSHLHPWPWVLVPSSSHLPGTRRFLFFWRWPEDLDFWCRNLPWKSWKSWNMTWWCFQFPIHGGNMKSWMVQKGQNTNLKWMIWLGMPPWLRKPPYLIQNKP